MPVCYLQVLSVICMQYPHGVVQICNCIMCFSLGARIEKPPIKPNLKHLMDALYHKVADKWKTIGLYLEIPKGKLEGITEKYRNDCQRCLVEMFEIWLEQLHPPPTWPNITATVEFLGEGQLGKEPREKYTDN